MGDHSHINNGTHRLSHFWPLIFTPYISHKPLFFTKNCLPKSSFFFHTVQNFGNFSLKDPKSAGIWEKGNQMPPIFMAFVTERPAIFCLACTCLRGMLLPQTRSADAGKCCILETKSCNQGDENKISVLQAQPTQLYIMDELHWRAGLIHRPSSLWSNTKGDISNIVLLVQPPSVWLCATWLSKQMPSVPEAVLRGGVRCNAVPAEGPGKILKYRSNLGAISC